MTIMNVFAHFIKTSLTLLTLAVSASVFSGCSMLSVYTIDIPQGTNITQAQANSVQIGMDSGQVLYLLGSPAVNDVLNPRRWDYIYDYQAGTEGRRQHKSNIQHGKQRLSIYFDKQARVSRIEGIETLPVK